MGGKSSKEKAKDKKTAAQNEPENTEQKETQNAEGTTKDEAVDKEQDKKEISEKTEDENKQTEEESKEPDKKATEQEGGVVAEQKETKEPKETESSVDKAKYEVEDIDKGLQNTESAKDGSEKNTETTNGIPDSSVDKTSESKENCENQEEKVKTPEANSESSEQIVDQSKAVETENKTEDIANDNIITTDENAIVEQLAATTINETKSEPQTEVKRPEKEDANEPIVVNKSESEITASTEQTSVTQETSEGSTEVNVSVEKDQESESQQSAQSEVANNEENIDSELKKEVSDTTDTKEKESLTTENASEVKKQIEIKWEHGGESVQLTGSFNNWTDKVPLEKRDDVFVVSLDLTPGEYLFKYFVDDEWKINTNQEVRKDGSGVENNFLVVGE